MKPLLALALLLLASLAARSEILPGHYSGALWSTACPVKVGASLIMDVSPNGHVNIKIVDDGATNAVLVGQMDARGRFFADNTDSRLVGRARFYNRDQYIIFTGTGRDTNCRYKFQGRWRRF